mgnify:CR=1 FL=1
MTKPVLSVRNLEVEFVTRRATLRAINGVSFDIAKGEVLGMVGESGAGKELAAREIHSRDSFIDAQLDTVSPAARALTSRSQPINPPSTTASASRSGVACPAASTCSARLKP